MFCSYIVFTEKRDSSQKSHESAEDEELVPTKKRRPTRSSMGLQKPDPSRRHVLPNVCIICHKEKGKYKRDKSTGLPQPERLHTVQTYEGGRLLKAAELKQRDDILTLIKSPGRDLPALEAKYHKSCMSSLTSFLTHPKRNEPPTDNSFKKSFDKFCDLYIKKRILERKEILTLSKLRISFVKLVLTEEKIDCSSYRSHNLKKRLQYHFPQLVFKSNQGIGDIVYAEHLAAEDVVESALMESDTTDTEGETTDTDESEVGQLQARRSHHPSKQDEMRNCFFSAKSMRNVIHESSSKAEVPWPPTAQTIGLESAKQLVPHQLFNWIAWTCGLNDEPNTSPSYVELTASDERRVLSIAQDILYLKTRGRLTTPKHVALSMAVRHLTGSSQLIGLLNGLGHSVSQTTTLEHDTALAIQQLLKGPLPIPAGIEKGFFSTMVWDNNDFGEETLSGKGTTHNTNGIIIQRHSTPQQSTMDHQPLPRSRVRSLQAPPTNLSPFFGIGGGQKDFGPAPIGESIDVSVDPFVSSRDSPDKLDGIHMLIRNYADRNIKIPSWTGFNTVIAKDVPAKSTVGYLPVIDAAPTKMETIQTLMERSVSYADLLQQDCVAVVFDQAIYAKAQKVRWEEESDTFRKKLVVRMGSFHTCMTYLACIGVRYKDAGLSDIMVESGIIASGSVAKVMNGHHYNRAVRCHKLTSEALQRLRWEAFLESLPEDNVKSVQDLIVSFCVAFKETPGSFAEIVKDNKDLAAILKRYKAFVEEQSAGNQNFQFWSTYIDMVQNLLHFIRASRQGNWPLHLSCIYNMLPWMFAYNRTNYSRYLPAYYIEMRELPQTHPEVHGAMMAGEFAVQRQSKYGFSQIPCDQTIESTLNRDTKTKGGLTGFTLKKGAVQRWIIAQPERAAITNQLKEMAGKGDETRDRKDVSRTRAVQDEAAVQSVISTITCMVNPFTTTETSLLQLSSGVVATDAVRENLMDSYKEGKDACFNYIKKRLQSKEEKMMSAIKKRKVLTFSDMAKARKQKVGGGDITTRADRRLFARLILIANVRKVDIKQMLVYCLGPYPLPISSVHGTLVKPNKAALLHHLEGSTAESPTVASIPEGSVWIIDGMALFQSLANRDLPDTFGEFAKFILTKLVNMAVRQKSTSIHFVTDTYPKESIKNAERGRRAATGFERIVIYAATQSIPKQWSKFLADGSNKEALVEFIFQEWCNCPGHLLRGVTVFLAHGSKCHAFRESGDATFVAEVRALNCTQEEADTRMFLHANYISQAASSTTIVIKCADTDVFTIGITMSKSIAARMLFHTGKGINIRTIDLAFLQQHLQHKYGDNYTDALIGLHAFTGCDSVSGFHGKGKVKPAKLLQKKKYQALFSDLGKDFDVTDDLLISLEKFVCDLYRQVDSKGVNEARYRLFCLGTHAEKRLPPNQDSLQKHILRANYQSAIWKRCLEQDPEIPPPHGYGWSKNSDGELAIDWGDLPPAPKEVMSLISCSCSGKKKCVKSKSGKGGCSCAKEGLQCTELCKCTGCSNKPTEEDDDSDDDGSDEDDDDSDIE